jgi:hypothetical protein
VHGRPFREAAGGESRQHVSRRRCRDLDAPGIRPVECDATRMEMQALARAGRSAIALVADDRAA